MAIFIRIYVFDAMLKKYVVRKYLFSISQKNWRSHVNSLVKRRRMPGEIFVILKLI